MKLKLTSKGLSDGHISICIFYARLLTLTVLKFSDTQWIQKVYMYIIIRPHRIETMLLACWSTNDLAWRTVVDVRYGGRDGGGRDVGRQRRLRPVHHHLWQVPQQLLTSTSTRTQRTWLAAVLSTHGITTYHHCVNSITKRSRHFTHHDISCVPAYADTCLNLRVSV